MATSATPRNPVAKGEGRSTPMKTPAAKHIPTKIPTTPIAMTSSWGAPSSRCSSRRGTGEPAQVSEDEHPTYLMNAGSVGKDVDTNPSKLRARPSRRRLHGGIDGPGDDERWLTSSATDNSTPSLISGSSCSTPDIPRPRVLRRKPSVIGKYMSQRQQTLKAQSSAQPTSESSTVRDLQRAPPAKPFPVVSRYESQKETPSSKKLNLNPSVAGNFPITPKHQHDDAPMSRLTPISDISTTPSISSTTSPGAFSHATTHTSLTSYSPLHSVSPQVGPQARASPISKRSGAARAILPDLEMHGTRQPQNQESSTEPIRNDAALPADCELVSSKRFAQTPSSRAGTLAGSAIPRKAEQMEKKGTSPSSKPLRKPAPVHPPELAHLMRAPEPPSLEPGVPPPRPSRDGTPSIGCRDELQPIVQSNLTQIEARGMRPARGADAISKGNGSFDVESGSLSNPTGTANASSSLPRLDTSGRANGPDRAGKALEQPSKGPSPEVIRSKSRFGLFSRRQKVEEIPKLPRKGPQAGTGHEGYGKNGLRGGSSSSTSVNSAPARTGSAGSAKQGRQHRASSGASSKASDLDDFLQRRLTPVYLRGDGSGSDGQERGSGSAFDDETPFSPISSSPQTSQSSFDLPAKVREQFKPPQLAAVPLPEQSEPRPGTIEGKDQDPSQSKSPSQQRKRLIKSPNQHKMSQTKSAPKATKTQASESNSHLPRPSTAGSSSSRKAGDQVTNEPTNKKSNWSLFPKPPTQNKGGSKWSIFQRSRAAEEALQPRAQPLDQRGRNMSSKTPAHYAMLESQQPVDMEDLERIMKEADAACAGDRTSTFTTFEDVNDSSWGHQPEASRSNNDNDLAHVMSKVPFVDREEKTRGSEDHERRFSTDPETQTQAEPTPKQSRLPQVGRIPKVVSKKDRHRKLPDQSFSRPFASAQPRPSMPPQAPAASSTVASKEAAEDSSRPEAKTVSQEKSATSQYPPSSYRGPNSANSSPAPAFLEFDARKNSDLSYSTDSGTIRYPTASYMAAPPDRMSASSPDEVWREYDDLIDDVLTPGSSTPSPKPPRGKQDYFSKSVTQSGKKPGLGRKGDIAFPRLGNPEMFTVPDAAAADFDPPKRLLDPPPNFEFPSPISAFVAGYAERNQDPSSQDQDRRSKSDRGSGGTNRSARSTSVYSERSVVASLTHKRSRSLPENRTSQDAGVAQERRTSGPNASENPGSALFRFRVLMTGKWLSFGRVLFSPVHNDMGSSPDDRVLVVDGLGKDWSYFCALTYPDSQIYSLGSSSSSSSSPRSSLGAFRSLSNHRHFTYPGGLSTDFPFPQSFFSAVVFRFPSATSEHNLRNAVSECKRVLRPGGYLEISAVDLDLNNMGPRCRRAVRGLKMSMQAADPTASLKPASDHLQSLLGRKGFENLNRCVVGVPAAGAIASSPRHSGDVPDLARLADDQSREGDEHMTKMVAQVGRWWYAHCYEAGVLPDGDLAGSMWNRGELLAECEELGTTFKLLICYAQKPTLAKRRTVSL